LRAGEFARQHWQDDTTIPNIYGILGRPEGGAWFVTGGSGRLGVVTTDEQRLIARPPRGFSGPVLDLVEHHGDVWIAEAGGLLRLQDGALVSAGPEESAGDQPECLALGPDGALYAGFRAKGLFCLEDGEWVFAGLDGRVGELALAPDHRLWARRGENELCWLRDDEWLRVDADEMGIVPEFNMVCSTEGSIWFQGLRGPVIRIDREAAEAWLQGDRTVDLKLRTYGRAEGLPAEQHPYGSRKRTLMEDSQGRIWVATVQGVSAWLPSYEARSAAEGTHHEPMPVLIEQVLLDDQRVLKPNGRVTVMPDKHRLEIRYAGLDLASPESVQYRYRIEGYQDEWVDVGNRHTAYLQRVPPGSYRFQVIAANRHGVWNEAGAALAIVVLPHWWEHWWFRFGTPAALLAALSGWASRQVRRARRRALERAKLQEEFSRGLIEAQESERTRLAGELHDDLGQDLLVMKSRIDLARRRSGSETEQDTLQKLSQSTAEVLHKVRSLSHQLRPLHLDHFGLAACVANLVKEVAEASQLAFEVEADDLQGGLSPECEVALFRMLQESLNNIVKHAGASSVKVALRRQERRVTLSVQDDGRGFHAEMPKPGGPHAGHWLHAMKERCALVGGRMMVHSTPGAGTLVLFEVPLSPAATA
ncbi:MAG: hypothetical protein KDM81_05690, partial [Verrucomicrobiae bacterium]|nr:hypothetical protein [Verrucomicrobiae bacterium]